MEDTSGTESGGNVFRSSEAINEGRGGQVVLAQRLGVTKAYLNNVLSGRAGRPDHIMGICSKICPAKKPT